MSRLVTFFIPLFLLYLPTANAQGEFDNASRVEYVFDISKYVEWEKEAMIQEFRIGILGSDSALYYAMLAEAATRDSIQKKPVHVYMFDSIADFQYCHVLYTHKKFGFDLNNVYEELRQRPVLLITENYPFHQSMLNFIVFEGKKKFELNTRLLEEHFLKVSPLFVAQAVKTKADWEKIYRLTEESLAKEREKTQAQKKEIEKQQEQIEQQQEQIKIQEDEINRQLQELDQLEKDIAAKEAALEKQIRQMAEQSRELKKQKQILYEQKVSIADQKLVLQGQKQEINKQKDRIAQQAEKVNQQLAEIEKQRMFMVLMAIFLFLLLGMAYFIWNNYKIKKKANQQLEEKNRKIRKQNKEIARQRDLAREQRDRIALQKKQITDSISYARRIQRAVLPSLSVMREHVDNFFILYKPKDIVSGDFYWESQQNGKTIIVAADCTGHGVPGAFMSMLGITFLNDIVNTRGIVKPDEILNELRENVITSLNQKGDGNDALRDGMDIAVCVLDRISGKVMFSGANNPMFLIRNKELIHVKGDKMPVSVFEDMVSFTNHELPLQKDDRIYIFSDGYVDQFGGEKGKKFMRKRLKETLLSIYHLPMNKQKQRLDHTFEEWKGDQEQIDDVVMIGFRI